MAPTSRSCHAVHEAREYHPCPELVSSTNPSTTGHDCRRAETRKGGEARREQSECSGELFPGKTSEQSHHFGSERSVKVCKPAYELSSNSENVHPSAPPVSDWSTCVALRSPAEREREPGPCEPHARSYRNVIHTTHASSKENPIPIAIASSISAWSSCTKVDDASLPGSVLEGGSE